ncbi:hypothetical protein Salat_0710900 [Sesamum alatum]|uniref:DUF7890 domain-containing protein n=1 Tax=Sesamum alatum TaxID=300844 RepID=A0AAE1YS66_9LAMI|nr:hypothetical protein Salat_0710900 [Sesamum alatum]
MDLLQSFLHYALTPKQRFQPKVVGLESVKRCIYREDDELDRKMKAVKKKVHFERASLMLQRDESEGDVFSGEEGRVGVRVRILMRKEEGGRLLSKCRDGGILELEDVAEELLHIPKNRVSVFDFSSDKKHN